MFLFNVRSQTWISFSYFECHQLICQNSDSIVLRKTRTSKSRRTEPLQWLWQQIRGRLRPYMMFQCLASRIIHRNGTLKSEFVWPPDYLESPPRLSIWTWYPMDNPTMTNGRWLCFDEKVPSLAWKLQDVFERSRRWNPEKTSSVLTKLYL